MAESPKEDVLDVDDDILEFLRMMHSDAPEEILQEAARSTSEEEAEEKFLVLITRGVQAAPVDNFVTMEGLKALEHYYTPPDGGFCKWGEPEFGCLLAAFRGNHGACIGIAMTEPHLIDLIIKKSWTIEEATLHDFNVKEEERKKQEYQDALLRAQQAEELHKLEQEQRSKYIPPSSCTNPETWKKNGDYLLQLATPNTREMYWTGAMEQGEVPRCWDGTHGVVNVEPGEEFTAVSAYLAGCMDYIPEIRGIRRVQNYEDFYRFRSNEGNLIMFHGCRAGSGGEQSIAMNGFMISKAVSVDARTGNRQGSWFAYRANYSDSGFVFEDNYGLRHIFLCIVSKVDVLHNIEIMRVVGEGCAIPLWIVTYSRPGRYKGD